MAIETAPKSQGELDGRIYKGPEPYGELDERKFFGRDNEIAGIVDLIEHNRLSVVTAPSGVGKTSVLLAGVVPQLRRRHELELVEKAIALGPTLVCRTWAGRTERSAEKILTDAIAEAVGDLRNTRQTLFLSPAIERFDQRDELIAEAGSLQGVIDELADVPAGSLNWRELMTTCSDRVSRLTLIFDQFEDALRLPVDGGKKLLRTIAALYQQEPRVRVLLSFRQEFIMRMHDLEVSIGGLFKRTYYLQSVTPDSVEAIVREPARAENIDVTDEAIETLKEWITSVPPLQKGADSRSDSDDAVAVYADEGGAFPLLALQALLVDIYDVLIKTGQRRTIDEAGLKEYIQQRGLKPRQLAQNALEHHIIKVLTTPTTYETSKMLDRLATGASPDEKNVLLQRLFARMPQHLTSGSRPGSPGYKKQISLGMLIEETLKDDFATLNASFRATQLDDLLNFVKNPSRAAVDIKESRDRMPDYDPLSGTARRAEWSIERTTQVLVLAVAELLRRLVSGNVLKPLGSGGEAAFELVHDGLGPPVLRWADRFRKRPEDALASLTRVNGVTFPWLKERAFREGARISNVSWTGCVIANQDLAGVSFRNCKLSGTMFIGCSFHGVTFENCDLDGAMFVKNKFFPAKDEVDGKACGFLGGQMQSALFSNCVFQDGNSVVEGVNLNGTVFIANDVFGKLSIRKSSLEVVVFRDCEYRDGGNENQDSGIFIGDCDFTFSRILEGKKTQTPVYLAGNQMHPEEASLFTHDPGHTHWTARR